MIKTAAAIWLVLASCMVLGFSWSFEKDETAPDSSITDCKGVYRIVGSGFGDLVEEMDASPAGVLDEGPRNLLDGSPDTKYITGSMPLEIAYTLTSAVGIRGYFLTSANDYPGRDPADWVLEGSADGVSWQALDSRQDEAFGERFEKKTYPVEDAPVFRYYRLRVTSRQEPEIQPGYTQLASFELITDTAGNEPVKTDGMTVSVKNAPVHSWINGGGGWKGSACLEIRGSHTGPAMCSAALREGLGQRVQKDTVFSYMILPDYLGEYDFDHVSQYAALDLVFTDGTTLSSLGAKDRDLFGMSAREQGGAKRMITGNWNRITCDAGKYAAGKTIDKIVVVYDNPNRYDGERSFLTYFDDVDIREEAPRAGLTPADYIVTTRGTNDNLFMTRGLTFPAVCVPNSFNFWTASTSYRDGQLYKYQPDSKITHFMSSHQASFHLGDHGNFMFMPVDVALEEATADNCNVGARARSFDFDGQTARAHYYGVTLDNGVVCELTPTSHAAAARFTFPEGVKSSLVLDCCSGGFENGRLTIARDGSFSGYLNTHYGAAYGTPGIYVYGRFDAPVKGSKKLTDDSIMTCVAFDKSTVTMYLATSYLSPEQARKNLSMEIGSGTFDSVRNSAKRLWNSLLGRVQIEGATPHQLTSFYSGMYRMLMYPTTLAENTGTPEKPHWVYASPYTSEPEKPDVREGVMNTSNGFWDTYRTAWSAYALLFPDKAGGLIDGITEHYNACGFIPKWVAPAGVECMVGTSSDVICADLMLKGIKFNRERAYLAALRNGSCDPLGSFGRPEMFRARYKGYGESMGWSWMADNCINDAGIAQMARLMGLPDDEAYFNRTAVNYTHMFNRDIGLGFFMTHYFDGRWKADKDTFDPWYWHGDYVESNGWGMRVTVPHDGNGLAWLYGGRDKLGQAIDEIMAADEDFHHSGRQHEMYEAREVRMGQYMHNNQQAHHTLYMYLFANEAPKTQKYVREVLSRLYLGSDAGQGYLGDEDNGEQSCWYILSSLGIYPLSLAGGEYAIGSPLFDRVTLDLPTGKVVIEAKNNSPENCYVQSLAIDGKAWNRVTIPHSVFVKARRITFTMGPRPSDWGRNTYPVSITKELAEPLGTVDLTTSSDRGELTDDDSNTVCRIDGQASLTAKEEKANLLTLTCDTPENAPREFALYGVAEEGERVLLEQRKNIRYEWPKQLKPFIIHKPGAYSQYILEIKGDVAEAELLK
ncbi:MAG: GH92 family glycosyl hydrolase [Abditibacteriota bacterium]|nr:GH92 family glycosyl hydrolase [Abditibacteriota bacterium]